MDVEKIAAGCGKGCLIYAALTILGLASMFVFGDRIDDRAITIENRTRHVFFAAYEKPFDDGGRHRIAPQRSTRFHPSEGDLMHVGGRRLLLFRSQTTPTPATALRLSLKELEALDENRGRIVVAEDRVLRMDFEARE